MLTVFAISDATGRTVERVVRAALVQFGDAPVRIIRHRGVRSLEQVRAILERAAGENAVVVHTLASNDLRRMMLEEARLRGVDAMDLMGPLLDRLAHRLELTPQEVPGLLEQLTEARSRSVEAIEFAFRHDDGQHADELGQAEIVLVGVSRTMKTPTMLYLAYRGWFVANVPLIAGVAPPAALLEQPAERVFCLWMAPDRLAELRRVRAQRERIPLEPYCSLVAVERELQDADQWCRRRGWRQINVTSRSVEELGQEIISMARRASGPVSVERPVAEQPETR
jgi:regulator of PEP synthase PpsR (kinase-PPPase family)